MKQQVTIVDYGIGNVLSLVRAFVACGGDVVVASNSAQIESARRLVLPGVGAFESGMKGLQQRNLVESVRAFAVSGRPLMGICLGMQMLATTSEEFGTHDGLDLIPGRVRALPNSTVQGAPQKIPHIGWVGLYKSTGADWRETPLAELREGDSVYVVHSFAVQTQSPEHELAYTRLGGRTVCLAISRGALIGCQFHPEKSGPVGLKVISSFLNSRS